MDRTNKEYYYNLGRVVALIEMIENASIVSLVQNSPLNKLPYWLDKAIKNNRHNLSKELSSAYDVIKDKKLQSTEIAPVEAGRYWIGYYHEKKFVDDNYKVIGEVTTTTTTHTPSRISLDSCPPEINNTLKGDNIIEELRK